jgi:hypothetical protein
LRDRVCASSSDAAIRSRDTPLRVEPSVAISAACSRQAGLSDSAS